MSIYTKFLTPSQFVKITQALFEKIDPDQMSHLKVAFDTLTQ